MSVTEGKQKAKDIMGRIKQYTARMQRFREVSFTKKGSGMSVYFDKEITRLFGEEMQMKALPVRNREELQLMVDMGFFDLQSSDNPILILKPLKEENEE